jgi:guanylate kinase
MKNFGKCIIFSAPSGSGKTTLVRELLKKSELNLSFSISATTRNKRQGEINGKIIFLNLS